MCKLTLPLIPAALCGFALAKLSSKEVSKDKLRKTILVLCAMASIIEIVHS